MKSTLSKKVKQFVTLVSIFCCIQMYAQFNVNGEIMTRSEYRGGYGNLLHKDSLPAVFIGSRCRIQFGHTSKLVKLHASVQDVRTFGGVPTKVAEPYLSLYEAWALIKLDTNFKLKIGRQELNYDNSRFFGSADWVLGGRTHDFVLLKFEKAKINIDLGGGFNQDGEKLSGNYYSGTSYKEAQLFRSEFKSERFQIAAMAWNEGRQFVTFDSIGRIKTQGMRFLQTVGIPTLRLTFGNITFKAFYYQQFGLNSAGKKTDAFDASADITHTIKLNEEKKRQLLYGFNGEVISGTNQTNLNENRSFSLLYGTNHALNGYMDLFYVGGRHEKSVGLVDVNFKFKFDLNKNFFCLLNAHYFQSAANIYDKKGAIMNPYLGSEIDFTTGVVLSDNLSLQAGYSQFFCTDTFQYLRGMTLISNPQNWGYLMVLYRPNGKKPFVGITY